ncbi:MAG TPA: hypothetical protein VFG23_04570 [Polyangia bacterium]|nr:hypothetical protein [Polyangia bacterium]
MSGTTIELGDLPASPPTEALTGVEIELRALELVAHWRRCGLTADWLARFVAYDCAIDSRGAAFSVLSTAINELLENAVKFCNDKRKSTRISVRHYGEFVRIETRNSAISPHVGTLRTTIEELGREPLDALFAERMQEKSKPGSSGIGLLLLKKDYGARLSVRLTAMDGGEWDILVRADLDISDVEQP